MADPEPIKETLDSKSANLSKKTEKTYLCSTCGSTGHPTSEHGKLGGLRANQGGVPGPRKRTLEAAKVKEHFIQRVLKHVDEIWNAQYNLAVGEQVLMVKIKERDAKGRVTRTYFEQVTDIETIKQYLDYEFGENNGAEDPSDSDNFFYLTTRPANNQALDSLMNRAVGKVPEKLEIEGGFFSRPTELIILRVGKDIDERDVVEGEVIDNSVRDGEQSGTSETNTETEHSPGPSAGAVS